MRCQAANFACSTQNFLKIQEDIKETSSRFFKSLPQSPGSVSRRHHRRLAQLADHTNVLQKRKLFESRNNTCEIAEFAFLSDSPVSISLRLSAVEFLIVDTLRRLVWQPFAPGIPSEETVSAARFETLSRKLSSLGTHTESTWRALTVHGLRAPSAEHEALERATGRMLELLKPFTDETSNSELSEALIDIVRKAMDVWDISRRDVCQILIQSAPNPDDDGGWMREDGDLFEDLDDDVDVDVTTIRSMSPICIFPKIVRGENSPTTIFRGRALFKESRLLALGRKESVDLQRMMTDAHKQFASQRGGESGLRTRSDRRSSIATQMTPNRGL